MVGAHGDLTAVLRSSVFYLLREGGGARNPKLEFRQRI